MKKEDQAHSRDKQTSFCPVSIDTSEYNSMYALAFNCTVQLRLRRNVPLQLLLINYYLVLQYFLNKLFFYQSGFKTAIRQGILINKQQSRYNKRMKS